MLVIEAAPFSGRGGVVECEVGDVPITGLRTDVVAATEVVGFVLGCVSGVDDGPVALELAATVPKLTEVDGGAVETLVDRSGMPVVTGCVVDGAVETVVDSTGRVIEVDSGAVETVVDRSGVPVVTGCVVDEAVETVVESTGRVTEVDSGAVADTLGRMAVTG